MSRKRSTQDGSRGAFTLLELLVALERRGIYGFGVRIRPADMCWLDWPNPIIAHFEGSGSTVGHFQVIVPCGGGAAALRVWDGLAGESMRPSEQLAADASGLLLLTSASPIRDVPDCLAGKTRLIRVGAFALNIALASFLWCAWRRRTSRTTV